MLRIWAGRGVGVVALALLLTACSGGGHPPAVSLAAVQVAPSVPPGDSGRDPRTLLVTMLTGLLSGPGSVEVDVTRGGRPVLRYAASFDSGRGLVQGVLHLTDPALSGPDARQRLLFEDHRAYVLLRPGCWLAGRAVPHAALAAALPRGSALDVLVATEALTYDAATQRLAGRVSVRAVLALLPAGTVARPRGPGASGTVPVSLPVQADGSIGELDVAGQVDGLDVRIRFAHGGDPRFALDPPTGQELADTTHTGCLSGGDT